MAEGSVTRIDVTFDHIVHVVHDPKLVREVFEQEFSLHTVPGGEHSAWGTYNALCYLGLSYIEWLGVRDAAKAATSAFGRLAQLRLSFGEGGSLFAIRTNEMDRLARSWQKRGLAFIGPVDASRNRPDGTTVRWRMLFPRSFDGSEIARAEAVLPFVIEWEHDDSTRAFNLRQTGAMPAQQPYQLAGVHIVTREMEAWVNGWNEYFSTDDVSPEHRLLKGANSFSTQMGGITLYVEPLQGSAESGNERTRFPGVERIDLIRVDGTGDAPSTEPKVIAGLSIGIVE
ncbi:VOC family protein [Alicyclobacillus sp. ALC3]|uniref:VOC family protein n=1 Tax=Alicyclobacillus sp. ALC3 TaxID=2796143 RepID=UPI0023785E66|nr:VOC family protein [Alicyclobacillus sp. ALC3]WDL97523.1 VOC family protein [Alicyclobacillus sp. ALC3]